MTSRWKLLLVFSVMIAAAFPVNKSGLAEKKFARLPGEFFNNPDYFPLGIWLQNPTNGPDFKALGINLFVGLWKGPTRDQLATLAHAGIPAIAKMNDVGLSDANTGVIVGWLQHDEPDNAQRIPGSRHLGPPIAPSEMIMRYNSLRKTDPSRPVLLNLGQGVAWDPWHGRGPRTNRPEDYPEYVQAADILSFDIYPVTHSNPEVRGKLDLVAKGISRLIQWTKGKKPVWAFIGTSRIGNHDTLPTPKEIRSQVWLALIHGATGIVYVAHQWHPKFIEAALLEQKEQKEAVTRINARITTLAPILNSPSIIDTVVAKAVTRLQEFVEGNPVTLLVKSDTCALYIFAGSRSRFSSRQVFQVKHFQGDSQVEVLDEGRWLSLHDGKFEDSFDPYGIHLYRIPWSRSNCPPSRRQ